MDRYRVHDWTPTCKAVVPPNCLTVHEAEYYKLPRVMVGVPPQQRYWTVCLESFPHEAEEAAKGFVGQEYTDAAEAVSIAGALLELALVEIRWQPFFIPHLGQPLTEEVAVALKSMDEQTRALHIERLLHEAAIRGATAPGLERLRQIMEHVFRFPVYYSRMPDEMDANPDLWLLRTSHR